MFRRPRLSVLIVDNSASMNATDVAPSRLAEAKHRAVEIIDRLAARDQMAVLSAGGPVVTHCGMTDRKPALRDAVEAIAPTDAPTRVAEAVALAHAISGNGPAVEIIVVSDFAFAGSEALAAAEDVEPIVVGTPGDNAAITRLAVRRSSREPGESQVLAEVTSFADGPVRSELELTLDGQPLRTLPVEVEPGGTWREIVEVSTAEGGRLDARLDRGDVYLPDNSATVQAPPWRTYRVRLPEQADARLRRAVEAIRGAELATREGPAAGQPGETVRVFQGEVPPRLPEGPVLVLDPASGCDLWQLGPDLDNAAIARTAGGHPLLAELNLEGLHLGQVRAVEPSAGAEPLAWTAGDVPLAWALDRPGGRVLVVSVGLEGGELAHRAELGILVRNSLDWLAGADRAETFAPKVWPPTSATVAESDVRVPAELVGTQPPPAQRPGPPLWLYLAAAALVVVAAEWCLFQRRWTC
jgi:hypothetical protein